MDSEQFNRISKALADPQRFAILERIAAAGDGELPCKAIVAAFDVSQATISHHLKELTLAGLIDGRKEAQLMYLTVRRSTVAAYQRELARRVRLK